jgi:8-amino-7-oxononanoate synthase
VIAAVAQRGDIILYDALSHASIRDGVRLSFATAYSFAHNDIADLEAKLKLHTQGLSGQIFVVTESVFSMDGDVAPVPAMAQLCRQYDAHLVIDEAHAIGVLGDKGEGLVQFHELHHAVFARIFTYGKAPGTHGAAVCGSEKLKSFLVNFSRSFIYTTALPESAVRAINATYDVFPAMQQERKILGELIASFQSAKLPYQMLKSSTPIQGVIVSGNTEAKQLASRLQENGLDIRPILYPSVPKGLERLRISLHAFNTPEQLQLLISQLSQ